MSDGGTSKEHVAFRCNPDIAETVEEYADEHGLTNSEAYRRVLETGVEVEIGDAEMITTDGGAIVDATAEQVREEFDAFARASMAGLFALITMFLWMAVSISTSFGSLVAIISSAAVLLTVGGAFYYAFREFYRYRLVD